MINKLSEFLTKKMLSDNTINDEDKELYVYGLFMLLSQLMFFIIACIFGFILNCIIESIIFYIAFQFIRRYAGGYHAKTETRCEILSSLSILCCIMLIKFSKIYYIKISLLCISLVCAVLIFIFCPLDTPEKPLSEKEFKYFRKISLIILLGILIAIAISCYFEIGYIFAPCCMSLILEGILISAGKIKKVHNVKKANS